MKHGIAESRGDRILMAVNTALLILILLIVAYPLVYTLAASFSDPNAINAGKVWLLPVNFTTLGFERTFQNQDIWIGYRNTVLYTMAGTLYNLFMTLPCAYALSHKEVPGTGLVTGLFLFTMYFGGGLIPTYFLMRNLHLINNPLVLILPTGASVWNLMVSRTFFSGSVPRELEEAALIDGANPLITFLRVVLPLSKPLVAIIALYCVVGHWNSYFSAMIYLKNRDLYPLQLFLREILVEMQMNMQALMSGTGSAEDAATIELQIKAAESVKYSTMIVSAVPLLIAYPFLQRYFVKGVMIGSVKG